jgi:hypothetical protein
MQLFAPTGGDDDHFAFGRWETALTFHQSVVVGHEGTQLVGTGGPNAKKTLGMKPVFS